MPESQENSTLDELVQFLTLDTRRDIRNTALKYLEGTSLSSAGVDFLLAKEYLVLKKVIQLFKEVKDKPEETTSQTSVLNLLINASSCSPLVGEAVVQEKSLKNELLNVKSETSYREKCAKLLANVTGTSEKCKSAIIDESVQPSCSYIPDVTGRFRFDCLYSCSKTC